MEEVGWLKSEVLSDDESRKIAAQSLGVPFVILNKDDISLDALTFIPEPLSRKHNVVAYHVEGDTVSVALLDLADLSAIDFLRHNYKVAPRLTTADSLKHALLVYQKHLKEKFKGMVEKGTKAADSLIRHAIHSNATHIHLEPTAAALLVRYRINGVLHEAMRLPERAGAYITERVKALAKLFPIKTAIQEGRFTFAHEGENIGVGVSTLPTASGEKMLLRLARPRWGQKGFTLESFGFHGDSLEMLHTLMEKKSGVLVVTGPEKSGKTTLLYTLVDQIDQHQFSVASVEEKIEYRLPAVAQTKVRTDEGFDTLAALRAVLRHDPDVVLVGDVVTKATAALCVEAATRAVFVIAGVESLAVEEVLQKFEPALPKAVVNLRQVRKLCQHCREVYNASRAELEVFEQLGADFPRILAALKAEELVNASTSWKDVKFYKAKGCPKCRAGYAGTVGLQEVLEESSQSLTLLEDALFKAALGLTSLEEVVYLAQ